MIRLLSTVTAALFFFSCAAPKQTEQAPPAAKSGKGESESKTGTIKVRVEFGEDGRVVDAKVIEISGDVAKFKPQDFDDVLRRIRTWKSPGKAGVYFLKIRFVRH